MIVLKNHFKHPHLFNQLLKQRTQRGALEFKIAEPTIKIDRDENVIDVIDRSRLTSHKLIEEFMLAANIVAADFLRKKTAKKEYFVFMATQNL